jgi:FKBP-type peptidyl-prolyl cis-trans isomerase FklB
MFRKLIPIALLLLAGCSETEETPQPQAAQEQQSQEMQAPQEVSQPQVAAEPGQAYLYINAQKPGVKVMASGLQFEILKSGEGRSPSATSNVVTHYHGTLVNGDVFDSSVDRGTPAEFPVNRVIAGWTEALQMMKEGDKWRLVLPPEIAYGERGAAGGLIPPNTVLVFEVELIEVKD